MLSGNPFTNLLNHIPRNIVERLPRKEQTDNRAELHAMIRALQRSSFYQSIVILSDSEYSVGIGIKYGKPDEVELPKNIANKDQVLELRYLIQQRKFCNAETEFHWIRAHDGNDGNEDADDLANKGALYSILPGHPKYIPNDLSEKAWKEIQREADEQ